MHIAEPQRHSRAILQSRTYSLLAGGMPDHKIQVELSSPWKSMPHTVRQSHDVVPEKERALLCAIVLA